MFLDPILTGYGISTEIWREESVQTYDLFDAVKSFNDKQEKSFDPQNKRFHGQVKWARNLEFKNL
jgi:hypothetical protein